eukprot:1719676-Rhodomonas_salina.2
MAPARTAGLQPHPRAGEAQTEPEGCSTSQETRRRATRHRSVRQIAKLHCSRRLLTPPPFGSEARIDWTSTDEFGNLVTSVQADVSIAALCCCTRRAFEHLHVRFSGSNKDGAVPGVEWRAGQVGIKKRESYLSVRCRRRLASSAQKQKVDATPWHAGRPRVSAREADF